jgi:hypothetical protein
MLTSVKNERRNERSQKEDIERRTTTIRASAERVQA